jgi:hypothetical protein
MTSFSHMLLPWHCTSGRISFLPRTV